MKDVAIEIVLCTTLCPSMLRISSPVSMRGLLSAAEYEDFIETTSEMYLISANAL